MSEENYIGEDGLLYCGVCHEPKEALWENGEAIFGSDRQVHPPMADCFFVSYATEKDVRRSAICLSAFAEAEGDDPLIIGFFLR